MSVLQFMSQFANISDPSWLRKESLRPELSLLRLSTFPNGQGRCGNDQCQSILATQRYSRDPSPWRRWRREWAELSLEEPAGLFALLKNWSRLIVFPKVGSRALWRCRGRQCILVAAARGTEIRGWKPWPSDPQWLNWQRQHLLEP